MTHVFIGSSPKTAGSIAFRHMARQEHHGRGKQLILGSRKVICKGNKRSRNNIYTLSMLPMIYFHKWVPVLIAHSVKNT